MNFYKLNFFIKSKKNLGLFACFCLGLFAAYAFDHGLISIPRVFAGNDVLISLDSATADPGSSLDLNVNIDPTSVPGQLVGLGWDFNYNPADIASIVWKANGPAATTAGKSATCNLVSAGDFRCAVFGLNDNIIDKGILGTITVTLSNSPSSNSVPITFSGLEPSDSAARLIPVVATNGIITVQQTSNPPPADTTAPTVSITSPASGAAVSGSTAAVSAAASDPDDAVADVKFYLDGSILIGTANAAPYSVVWDTTTAANGAHTLTARATDSHGNAATSAGVDVTVSNSNPNPNPTPLACQANGSTNITASQQVGFTVSGGHGPYTLSAPGASSVSGLTTTYNVSGSYQVTANDAAGGHIACGTVTVSQPQQPLLVCQAASSVNVNTGQSVAFRASGGNGQYAWSAAGGNPSAQTLGSSSSFSTSFASAGSFTVSVRSGDGQQVNCPAVTAAQVSSAPPADTTAPAVSIKFPSAGTTVSGVVTVEAAVSDPDDAVADVKFYLDGSALIGSASAFPFTAAWSTASVTGGLHTLSARAVDSHGNSATSAGISVNVNNPSPNPNPSPSLPPPANNNPPIINSFRPVPNFNTDTCLNNSCNFSYFNSTTLNNSTASNFGNTQWAMPAPNFWPPQFNSGFNIAVPNFIPFQNNFTNSQNSGTITNNSYCVNNSCNFSYSNSTTLNNSAASNFGNTQWAMPAPNFGFPVPSGNFTFPFFSGTPW